MATIVARKGKRATTYQVIVRRKGWPTETRTFKRKTDAQKWARNVERNMDQGEFASESVARSTTLSELVGQYLASPEVGDLSPVEQRKRPAQLNWWVEKLGDPTLDRILDGRLILRALEDLRKGGRSGATTNRYLAAIRKCLAYGVRHRLIFKNPARGLGSAKELKRVRRLTPAERKRLLVACERSKEPRLYPLTLLALASGGRQGELLALTWGDLDFERARVQFTNTKNGDSRGVGISPEVLQVLRERLLRHVSGLVFADETGRSTWPRDAWDKAVSEAKLKDFRFHDTRHDYASRLAESGATLAELAEALGHRTLAMVKRYSHLTEGHVADVTRRASEALL